MCAVCSEERLMMNSAMYHGRAAAAPMRGTRPPPTAAPPTICYSASQQPAADRRASAPGFMRTFQSCDSPRILYTRHQTYQIVDTYCLTLQLGIARCLNVYYSLGHQESLFNILIYSSCLIIISLKLMFVGSIWFWSLICFWSFIWFWSLICFWSFIWFWSSFICF